MIDTLVGRRVSGRFEGEFCAWLACYREPATMLASVHMPSNCQVAERSVIITTQWAHPYRSSHYFSSSGWWETWTYFLQGLDMWSSLSLARAWKFFSKAKSLMRVHKKRNRLFFSWSQAAILGPTTRKFSHIDSLYDDTWWWPVRMPLILDLHIVLQSPS